MFRFSAEWEIETIMFNTKDFALNTKLINNVYPLSSFSKLRNEPIISTNEKGFSSYETSFIAGVVIGYQNIKRIVYLLTENDGVVLVKMTRNNYTKYQEKLKNDGSWFERGTRLVCQGYKSGSSFNCRGGRKYRTPVAKIEDYNGGYVYRVEKGE